MSDVDTAKSIVIIRKSHSLHLEIIGENKRANAEGHTAFEVLRTASNIINRLICSQLFPEEEFKCQWCEELSLSVKAKGVDSLNFTYKMIDMGGFDVRTGNPICEECMKAQAEGGKKK